MLVGPQRQWYLFFFPRFWSFFAFSLFLPCVQISWAVFTWTFFLWSIISVAPRHRPYSQFNLLTPDSTQTPVFSLVMGIVRGFSLEHRRPRHSSHSGLIKNFQHLGSCLIFPIRLLLITGFLFSLLQPVSVLCFPSQNPSFLGNGTTPPPDKPTCLWPLLCLDFCLFPATRCFHPKVPSAD